MDKTKFYKNKLYKLNYKYTNQLKKEEDMKIFKMNLKELYSLDICPNLEIYQKII